MDIKKELYDQCKAFVENRFQTVQSTMDDIRESLLSETKSSAGDKHETGRAMLQLEREKAGNQLVKIQKVKDLLSKINTEKPSDTIGLGSVVYTSGANYFIAISAGELKVGNDTFYAISPSTPIARALTSKKEGDLIQFRNATFIVTNIV